MEKTKDKATIIKGKIINGRTEVAKKKRRVVVELKVKNGFFRFPEKLRVLLKNKKLYDKVVSNAKIYNFCI